MRMTILDYLASKKPQNLQTIGLGTIEQRKNKLRKVLESGRKKRFAEYKRKYRSKLSSKIIEAEYIKNYRSENLEKIKEQRKKRKKKLIKINQKLYGVKSSMTPEQLKNRRETRHRLEHKKRVTKIIANLINDLIK